MFRFFSQNIHFIVLVAIVCGQLRLLLYRNKIAILNAKTNAAHIGAILYKEHKKYIFRFFIKQSLFLYMQVKKCLQNRQKNEKLNG